MGHSEVFPHSESRVNRTAKLTSLAAYVLVGMVTPQYATGDERSCDHLDHAQSVICSIDNLRQIDQTLTPEQLASHLGFRDIREMPKCLGHNCREYQLINNSASSYRSGASLIIRPGDPDQTNGFYADIRVEIDDNKLCITVSDIEDAFGKEHKNSLVLTKKIESDKEWEDYLSSTRGLAGHIYYKFDEATRSSMSFRFSYRPCANLMNFSKYFPISE